MYFQKYPRKRASRRRIWSWRFTNSTPKRACKDFYFKLKTKKQTKKTKLRFDNLKKKKKKIQELEHTEIRQVMDASRVEQVRTDQGGVGASGFFGKLERRSK